MHAIDCLFPERLTEPDLETVDVKATPATGQKVPPFMDDDHDIEHHDDENYDADKAKGGDKDFHRRLFKGGLTGEGVGGEYTTVLAVGKA